MATVTVNGTKIAFELNGKGREAILLLPGLSTGRSYFKFFEPLLRDTFQTILVDPRGLGLSSSEDREYTAEVWADDFAALIDHLNLGPVHVLGSSHGGSMALSLADRYSDRLRSLIVAGGFSELNRLIEINLRLRINIVSKLGMGPEIADHVSMWTNRAEFLDSDQGLKAIETNTKAVMAANPDRYIAMVRSMQHWGRVLPEQSGEPKFTTRLAKLSVPTLAVSGDSDHYIPASLSKIIAETVPGGQYREIPQCGHIAVQEKPQEVAALVKDYIESLSG